MVRGDACFTIDRTAFQQLEYGVIFEARDEEDALCRQNLKPGVGYIAFVKGHNGTFWQRKAFGHAAFVGFGIADIDEGGDVAIVIKHGIYLHPGFVPPERCPGEDGQAKADGGGVHAVQFALEAKFVTRRMRLAKSIHFSEQVLEKAHGP